MKLRDAPHASLDLETTGTDAEARIVEIAIVRRDPGVAPVARRWLVAPGVPIPASATAIHGITDAMVADAPRFADMAAEVYAALDGCVVVGHNVLAYDLPLLRAHFARACEPWPCEESQVIDTLTIDRARTRHTLTAVYRRWTGRELEGAHGALADAEAALAVLDAMAGDASVEELAREGMERYATPCGRVLWGDDGRAVWGFGKLRGRPVSEDRNYATWVAYKAEEMPESVRAIARRGAQGEDVKR